MKITDATNFLRVFQLPDELPEGYCFGGGCPSEFVMVDWFNAFTENGLEFDGNEPEYTKHIDELRDFIKEKRYFSPDHTYMVLTDYGDIFLVNPEKRPLELQKQYDEIRQRQKNDNSSKD